MAPEIEDSVPSQQPPHDEVDQTWAPTDAPEAKEETEETEALDRENVLELEAFIERKQWIQEQIKFLELLPVIDVYAGSQHLREDASDERPSHQTLKFMIEELEALEQQTEQFDAGDMLKLKQFAKDATKRNLSPSDTDLIEVTMDTLVALDKLLHLLRTRSEALDTLALRLKWEDSWRENWAKVHVTLKDIGIFLTSRARWSPDVYERLARTSDIVHGSSVPINSTASSPTSQSKADLLVITRGARLKFGDLLSRDAAQISSRWNILKTSGIVKPGKFLDQLIDFSRVPVPEYFLDEQDKLEDLCTRELGNLGVFVMAAATQWKKYDEAYAEAKKDQASAEELIRNLSDNLKGHPSIQMWRNLALRLSPLEKRTTLRRSSLRSTIDPQHTSFPQQSQHNQRIARILEDEADRSRALIFKASQLLQTYREKVDALDALRLLLTEMDNLASRFGDVSRTVSSTMVPAGTSDSSRPVFDFNSGNCLKRDTSVALTSLVSTISNELDTLVQGRLALMRKLQPIRSCLHDCTLDAEVNRSAMEKPERLLALQETAFKDLETLKDRLAIQQEIQIWWDELTRLLEQSTSIDTRLERLVEGLVSIPDLSVSGIDNAPTTSDYREVVAVCDASFEQMRTATNGLEHSHLQKIPESFHGTKSIQHIRNTATSFQDWLNARRRSSRLLLELRSCFTNLTTLTKEGNLLLRRIHDMSMKPQMSLSESDSIEAKIIHELITQSNDDWTETKRAQDEVDTFLANIQSGSLFLDPRRIVSEKAKSEVEESPEAEWPSVIPRRSHDLHVQLKRVDDKNRQRVNTLAASLTDASTSLVEKFRSERLAICSQRIGQLRNAMQNHLSSAKDEAQPVISLVKLAQESPDSKALPEWQEALGNRVQFKLSRKSAFDDTQRNISQNLEALRQIQDAEENIKGLYNQIDQDKDAFMAEGITLSLQADELESSIPHILSQLHDHFTPKSPEPPIESEESHAPEPQESRSTHEPEATPRVEKIVTSNNLDIPKQTLEGKSPFVDDPVRSITGPSQPEGDGDAVAPLLKRIDALRFRIRHFSFGSKLDDIPSSEIVTRIQGAVEGFHGEHVSLKEQSIHYPQVKPSMDALHSEIEELDERLSQLRALVGFGQKVSLCDKGISNLLNALDSFQESPKDIFETHGGSVSDTISIRKSKISAALQNVLKLVGELTRIAVAINDPRANSELDRITQTVDELEDMTKAALESNPPTTDSRAASTVSLSSSTSEFGRSNASVQTPKAKKYLEGLQRPIPRTPRVIDRRMASSAGKPSTPIRSPATSRSVSGPVMGLPNQRPTTLYNSTFASRSRTTSLSGGGPVPGTPTRPPSQVSQFSSARRPMSPAASEIFTPRRPSTLHTPRPAMRSISSQSSHKPTPRRPYTANPASQLDMAVGRVINRLPMGINMRAERLDWKDRSGKYWIGNEEPRLYFCRILRSETVMVRVGGGWSELSRFIKDHFSDFDVAIEGTLFAKDEKWISAASLKKNTTHEQSRPGTPINSFPSVPSVIVSTPESKKSPRSIHTLDQSPPLTQIQFIRKADSPELGLPIMQTPMKTPSKSRHPRTSQLPGWLP